MNKIVEKIQTKLSQKEDVLTELRNLPGSELNSFLLELFRLKSEDISPSELLNQFGNNRFVTPSETNIIKIKKNELEWLKYAEKQGFSPVNLSPLAPFGSCSVVGLVNQNNVVSALRGTEIVSDATNVLALKIANDMKGAKNKQQVLKYSTTHRHVRGQYFTNPEYSAHFSVFCLASGGSDRGNYHFELSQLNEHFSILFHLLSRKFPGNQLTVKFYLKSNSEHIQSLVNNNTDPFWSDKVVEFQEEFENRYYQTIHFKIFLKKDGQEIDLADGGDVDWTQKLLGNKKHRLFISGAGLELIEKMSERL